VTGVINTGVKESCKQCYREFASFVQIGAENGHIRSSGFYEITF